MTTLVTEYYIFITYTWTVRRDKEEKVEESLQDLIGSEIEARDGDMGRVRDFYFDDRTWNVRYAVVETGGWFSSKPVLLEARVLGIPDSVALKIPADVTRDQVKNSPDMETDLPLSAVKEKELRAHYGRPVVFPYASPEGAAAITPETAAQLQEALEQEARDARGDPHLRSIRAITGYSMKAPDGDAGKVEDFLIQANDWSIRSLVVDISWLPGGNVTVPTTTVQGISFDERCVYVSMSREQVKEQPEYIKVQTPTRPSP